MSGGVGMFETFEYQYKGCDIRLLLELNSTIQQLFII